MNRPLFISFILVISFSVILLPAQKEIEDYTQLYQLAEKLYKDPNPTDQKDSAALAAYKKIIALLEDTHHNDSILWDSYVKAAIFEQTYNNYDKAIPLLLESLTLQAQVKNIPGSASYLPAIYLGNSYYTLNRFDSARYYYKQAEIIAAKYPNIEGLERLYNTYGILNFETGNYRQSKNNFEKAISILEGKKSPDTNLLVYFKNNLASVLCKLYEFDEAMAIYKSLLPYKSNIDGINQNIASVYLNIGASPQAIHYLHQVKNNNLAKLNDLGRAYYNLKQYDSADSYLNQAFIRNKTENGNRKNIYAGLTYRYKGDILYTRGDYLAALQHYQESIRQMIFSFNDSSIYANPVDYTGVFAVPELYEILLAKAETFQSLYEKQKNTSYLDAALHSFHSLYKLTDYAEKTYESDEARIFLNQKKHISHNRPIETCIRLYQLTGNKKYLEEAFFFDEQNKASVLSLELSDAAFKKAGKLPVQLIAEESNCKQMINRLSLKASATADSMEFINIHTQMREQELLLESINKKFNEYPAYHQLKFADTATTIAELQEKVLPDNTVILSYHMGDTSLLCWIISKNNYEYVTIPYSDSITAHIEGLSAALSNHEGSGITPIRIHALALYKCLIKPLEEKIKPFDELLIIPDDELSYVPFELLLDASDQYLIKKFAVSYNYAGRLLKNNFFEEEKKGYSLLAYAPYSTAITNSALPALPASQKEIEGLTGKLVSGNNATKESFIQLAPHYSILHLATHAKTNDGEPLQSYIAFYPQHPDTPSKDRMYIPDIYTLSIPKTSLVILSACETGSGQLIKGEGIISLSRAFSYAGCPNIITSQWKADDESTAYITRRLHHYLEKGNGIARALQKAKIDYLEDNAIENRFKTPAYWAHLRFTGQPEKNKLSHYYWWALFLPLVVLLFFAKKIRSVEDRTSNS